MTDRSAVLVLAQLCTAVLVTALLATSSAGTGDFSPRRSPNRRPGAPPSTVAPRYRPGVLGVPGAAAAGQARGPARSQVLWHVRGRGRVIALTFDDGPDPRWTAVVLGLLARYRAHATFCLIGRQIPAHPEVVRRMAAAGDALCDHTWSHDEHLALRPLAVVRSELTRTYDAIRAASGGAAPLYFRAPGGRWGSSVLGEARRLGLLPLGWNLDTRDWTKPGAAAIVQRVLAGARPGAVVLMHDGGGDRSGTTAALSVVLATLTRRGYRFVTP